MSSAASSTDLAKQRTDFASERTKDAIARTRLAYERTMMAWVRTATSLISFGFTIYKFFEYLHDERPPRVERLLQPRGVALVMIGLGVLVLVMASWQHRETTRELREQYRPYGQMPASLAGRLALIMAGLGTIGLVMVFFRQ